MEAIDRKKALSTIAFAFVLAIFLVVGSLYLYNIFKWAAYPDVGYRFRTTTRIRLAAEITEICSRIEAKRPYL